MGRSQEKPALKAHISNNRRYLTGVILLAIIIGVYSFIGFAQKAEPIGADRTVWLTSKFIAHKGLHNNGLPENTIGAFNAALVKGFPIELDVSMTRDKQIVVFHDKKLKRLLGKDGYLKDITYQELAQLGFPNSTERVPLSEPGPEHGGWPGSAAY